MGILHESAASIGFYGDDLDPDEITRALGSEPTVGVRKGGVWHTRSGVKKVALKGSWLVQADRCQPGNVEMQINDLLDSLSDDLSAWRGFARRYRGRIFCGLFLESGNEGFTLHSSTLVRVGERGLLIDFDIYGADLPD